MAGVGFLLSFFLSAPDRLPSHGRLLGSPWLEWFSFCLLGVDSPPHPERSVRPSAEFRGLRRLSVSLPGLGLHGHWRWRFACFPPHSLWELPRRLGKNTGYQWVMGKTTDTYMDEELDAGEREFAVWQGTCLYVQNTHQKSIYHGRHTHLVSFAPELDFWLRPTPCPSLPGHHLHKAEERAVRHAAVDMDLTGTNRRSQRATMIKCAKIGMEWHVLHQTIVT